MPLDTELLIRPSSELLRRLQLPPTDSKIGSETWYTSFGMMNEEFHILHLKGMSSQESRALMDAHDL